MKLMGVEFLKLTQKEAMFFFLPEKHAIRESKDRADQQEKAISGFKGRGGCLQHMLLF